MPVTKMSDENARRLFGSGLVMPGPKRNSSSSTRSTGSSPAAQAASSTNRPSEAELNEQMQLMERMDAALHTLGAVPKVVSVGSNDPLEQLLAMELKDRLDAVVQDLHTNEKRFSSIDAHDLARALGIDDCDHPGSLQNWSFICYARIVSVEEYAGNFSPVSEIVHLIEDQVEPNRFSELLTFSAPLDGTDDPKFDFLTSDERRMLELAIAEDNLEGHCLNGMNCLAHYSINVDHENRLEFEAVVEDDGTSFILRSPYDKREGNFENLTNCVTRSW